MGGDLNRKRERKKFVVVQGAGDACPRCGEPMQIRQYENVDEKQLDGRFFRRWFCCMNKTCKTSLVMPAGYRVV
jgi:hypothetical protein